MAQLVEEAQLHTRRCDQARRYASRSGRGSSTSGAASRSISCATNLLRPPNSGAPPSLPPPPQCHLSRCKRGTGLRAGRADAAGVGRGGAAAAVKTRLASAAPAAAAAVTAVWLRLMARMRPTGRWRWRSDGRPPHGPSMTDLGPSTGAAVGAPGTSNMHAPCVPADRFRRLGPFRHADGSLASKICRPACSSMQIHAAPHRERAPAGGSRWTVAGCLGR